MSDVLNALKKCINEETRSRCIDIEKCKDDVDRIIMKLSELDDVKMEIFLRLDHIQSTLMHDESYRSHVDILINDNGVHIAKVQRLETELEDIKFEVSESVLERDKEAIEWKSKLTAISTALDGQNKDLE